MISFVVITDNEEPEKLARTIRCIQAQDVPGYELFVIEDKDHCGHLGALRNEGCRKATNNVLVVIDDDIHLHKNFYTGLLKYGNDFDILSCKILNPDGTRYWDWKINVNGANQLLDYDRVSEHISLTGGLTIMKRKVFERVQWDETLGFYQAEDVDWTARAKKAGFRIAFNPYSTVTHNDSKYTQRGMHVYRI